MYLQLTFDIEDFYLYIPDGYISCLAELKESFIDWCQSKPEAFTIAPAGIPGYRYSKDLFLQYINDVLLIDCSERAYFIDICRTRKSKIKKIKF